MITAGEAVLYVAVPAALMAVFYTADPFSLKAKGLGDLVIFLMFGQVMQLDPYLLGGGPKASCLICLRMMCTAPHCDCRAQTSRHARISRGISNTHCTTAPLHHCTTAPLHHCTTCKRSTSLTAARHDIHF